RLRTAGSAQPSYAPPLASCFALGERRRCAALLETRSRRRRRVRACRASFADPPSPRELRRCHDLVFKRPVRIHARHALLRLVAADCLRRTAVDALCLRLALLKPWRAALLPAAPRPHPWGAREPGAPQRPPGRRR